MDTNRVELLNHPKVGDKWRKVSESGKVLARQVVELNGRVRPEFKRYVGNVVYLNEKGHTKTCWSETWIEWCRGAVLEVRGT
jgi:hypothetical protein